MEFPQEIELWYIIPSIRKALAKNLKSRGLKQKQIAKALNLTEGAVSQYIKDKRARSDLFTAEIDIKIQKSGDRIFQSIDAIDISQRVMHEIQSLCTFIKDTKFICKIHHQKNKKLKNCKICYPGE